MAAVKAAIMACGLQLKVGSGGCYNRTLAALLYACFNCLIMLQRAVKFTTADGVLHDTPANICPQAKIARQQAAREHQQRKRNLTKYIPNTAAAIFNVLEAMAGTAAR